MEFYECMAEEDTEVTTEEEQSTTSIESVLYEAKDSRAVGELIGEHKDDIDSYVEGRSSKYSLKRLMLFTSDKLKESYNATDIIHIGDYEEYVLQFETEEDTEAAYNSLLAKYGKDNVFIDQVLDADSLFGDQTYAASVEVKFTNAYSLNDTVLNQNGVSYSSYTPISWGVKDMGMDVLKSDFNNHNFTNSVKVAVVDTGLDDSHYIFNGRVDVDHSYNFADGSWNYTDENGSVKRISVEDAKVGDKIVVHTGEKICVDGKIISGEAIVDESAVTGEYVPHIKKIGSEVYSGTLVKNGNIVINTERAGEEMNGQNMLRL